MQFKFDANQEYQVRAIESVAGLLEGQPRNEADLSFSLGGFAAVPNRLDLDEPALLSNLQSVQRENGLPADDTLQLIEESIETVEGNKQVRFGNFSVEMETGTGKTYVYLRTALELYRRHGLRKFIVVVPSVAVREGVLKALKVTEKHLRELYGNTPYRYYCPPEKCYQLRAGVDYGAGRRLGRGRGIFVRTPIVAQLTARATRERGW